MLTDHESLLRSLIESKHGIHLTGYIANTGGDKESIKRALTSIRDEAYEFLSPVLPTEERKKFLEPIENLMDDGRILKEFKGNIGIFRKKNAFRILNVPVEVEPSCSIADTFHVKPLLKWLQSDHSFLILGLTPSAAHLYYGQLHSLSHLGTLPLHVDYKGIGRAKSKFRRALEPVHQWFQETVKTSRPRLFIAGPRFLTQPYLHHNRYKNLFRIPIAEQFDPQQMADLLETVRKVRAREVALKIEKTVLEFHVADQIRGRGENIFQIAKAALSGKVKKLIVADDVKIFGKLNSKTGDLILHPYDLDHEDDDILDDLAQTVIALGGEVIVTSRSEIPQGRPLSAIIESENNEVASHGLNIQRAFLPMEVV